jgi:hypothetical protein
MTHGGSPTIGAGCRFQTRSRPVNTPLLRAANSRPDLPVAPRTQTMGMGMPWRVVRAWLQQWSHRTQSDLEGWWQAYLANW